MKHSLILFLLILFLVFVSCGGFLESFESEENNPHCTIFFHNQSDGTVYVRVDGWLNDCNQPKWIMETWPKEIKAKSMDSLCVLARASNGTQPTWLDLKNNNRRDSIAVLVFDTFTNAARYDRKNPAKKQYLFVTKDLGGGNTKEIVFVNDENDNKK